MSGFVMSCKESPGVATIKGCLIVQRPSRYSNNIFSNGTLAGDSVVKKSFITAMVGRERKP